MECAVLNNFELCFVCNEYMNKCRNHLSVTTGYSEKSLHSLIESFIDQSLSDDVLSDGAVCQSCMMKFTEYDQHATKAIQLKDELINKFRTSRDSSFSSNFQLSDGLVESEFDFGLNDMIFKDDPKTKKSIPKVCDDVSPEFRKILQDEGIQYSVEVFHRTFGGEEAVASEKKIKSVNSSSRSNKSIGSLNCDFCATEGFKNRRSFISHLRSHRPSAFYCETCQMSFKAASSLKIHLTSNHGSITRNIPCPFNGCGKSFANKISLRAHFICHNKADKKPEFVCDTCGKEFHYKVSFTQHLKIHSGVRDKQCEICGFKVISSTHLQRHIRARHTKEKNHFCGFCGKAFSERYNMKSHERKQHIETKLVAITFFKCTVCCMEYSDTFKLKQHMQLNHNIVEVIDEGNFVI